MAYGQCLIVDSWCWRLMVDGWWLIVGILSRISSSWMASYNVFKQEELCAGNSYFKTFLFQSRFVK